MIAPEDSASAFIRSTIVQYIIAQNDHFLLPQFQYSNCLKLGSGFVFVSVWLLSLLYLWLLCALSKKIESASREQHNFCIYIYKCTLICRSFQMGLFVLHIVHRNIRKCHIIIPRLRLFNKKEGRRLWVKTYLWTGVVWNHPFNT